MVEITGKVDDKEKIVCSCEDDSSDESAMLNCKCKRYHQPYGEDEMEEIGDLFEIEIGVGHIKYEGTADKLWFMDDQWSDRTIEGEGDKVYHKSTRPFDNEISIKTLE